MTEEPGGKARSLERHFICLGHIRAGLSADVGTMQAEAFVLEVSFVQNVDAIQSLFPKDALMPC